MPIDSHQENLAPLGRRKSWVPSKLFWVRFIIVLGLISPLLMRTWVLSKVPEIDVPFDVDDVYRVEIEPGENAFDYFREAYRLMQSVDGGIEVGIGASNQKFPWSDFDAVMTNGWEAATDELKEALAPYGESLKVWRRGTECSDSLYVPLEDLDYETAVPVVQSMRTFTRLACCEGLRLESEGNLIEAGEYYVANLRCSQLLRRNASLISHLVGIATYAVVNERLVHWSEDSRITADQLRSVLNQVRDINQRIEPDSTVLKIEFLSLSKTFKRNNWCQSVGLTEKFAKFEPYASTGMGTICWILGEPEFTRRTALQLLANQLPEIDKPNNERAEKVGSGTALLFEPRESLKRNHLPLAAIERAIQRSFVAEEVLRSFSQAIAATGRNRARRTGLELTLMAQLYFREHGEFPADVSAFVPQYIDIWSLDPFLPAPGGPMDYQRESPTSARIRSQGSWGFDATLTTRLIIGNKSSVG